METRIDEIASECTASRSSYLRRHRPLDSPTIISSSPAMNRSCFTAASAKCSRWYQRPLPRSCRWNGCAGLLSDIFEADECGSMNEWLAAAPAARADAWGWWAAVFPSADMADRPPRVLSNGEVINIGGKRLRYIDTPHVPHGWDAGVMFEETTQTLFVRRPFYARSETAPRSLGSDIVEPVDCDGRLIPNTRGLGPTTGSTIRKLADLKPKVLATMHGTSYSGMGLLR